jgi:hypothetical protein
MCEGEVRNSEFMLSSITGSGGGGGGGGGERKDIKSLLLCT